MKTAKTMKTITKETKKESYIKILPTISNRQRDILRALADIGVATANELALYLFQKGVVPNFSRNYVHPRLTELLDLGVIEIFERRFDKITNRKCNAYRLVGSKETCTKINVDFKRDDMVDVKDFCLMALQEIKTGTANEIAMKLFEDGIVNTFDRHYVHPRLTELLEVDGKIRIIGKRLDTITSRTNAVFELVTN